MVCRATSDTPTLPQAPTGLTLVGTDANIRLDWDDNAVADGVTNYKVYRGTNQGGAFTLKSSPTSSTYTDTTGVTDTVYWYRVSAVNAAGEGPYTDVSGSFSLDTTAPGNVTITEGPTQIGKTATHLVWTPPIDSDFVGNKVYGKIGTGSYSLLSGAALDVVNLFDHLAASTGNTWTYKITSLDFAGNESSGTVSSPIAIPGTDTTPPATPTGLVATGRSDGVLLEWTANTEYDIDYYNIYGNETALVIGTATTSPTSYLDTTAVVNALTGYYITAVDLSANESDPTAPAFGTRLETTVNSLDAFLVHGSMVPCCAFARGIDYRQYKAVDSGTTSTVTLTENLDFLAITNGNQLFANYAWSFAAGTTQPKGAYPAFKGFNGAHSYDVAGQYIITLTRTDKAGKTDVFTSTINLAPDTRIKVYCTPFGDNASTNNGQDPTKPISVARAQNLLATTSNLRLRLQNGATYNTAGTLLTLSKPNQIVEGWSFGTPSSTPPILNFSLAPQSSVRAMISVKASATDAVVQNLQISRTYNATDTQAGLDKGVSTVGAGRTLVRNVTFIKTGYCLVFDNADRTSRYVLVESCTAPNKDSIHDYFAFVTGQDIVFLGCKFVNSLRQHGMRLSQHNRTLVAYCDFQDQNNQAKDPLDDIRTPITPQQGVDFYAYQNKFTADISGADVKVGLSKQLGAVTAGPLRSSTSFRSQYGKYFVFEGNTINAKFQITTGMTDLMLRNNIIDRADSQCVTFDSLAGTDVAGLPWNLPIERVYIYNNTCRDNGASGTIFKVADGVDELEIINNHCLGSNMSTNANNALCCDFRGGFGSNNKVQRNCFPVSNNYRVGSVTENVATFNLRSQAAGTNIKEATTVDLTLKPASNSLAATHARPKQGVFDDLKNTTRAPKATTWTCGAYQL